MPSHQSKEQRGTVERVMHEFKEGELKTGRGKGPKVKNPKQAIAIALHEAGASNQDSPKKNKQALSRTKSKERKGQTAEGKKAQDRTLSKGESRSGSNGSKRSSSSRSSSESSKAELYARAKQRNIPGRSKMSKSELQRALSH